MSSTSSPVYQDFTRQPIGKQWRHGTAGKKLANANPYNNEILAEIPLAGRADLEEGMIAAQAAQPGWGSTPAADRAAMLLRLADIFVQRKEDITSWLVREVGSSQLKAAVEWGLARSIVLEAASYPSRLHGRLLSADATGKEHRIYRKPLGVVGVISPWNFPLHLSMRSIATALACGNTVVHKPASDSPITGGLLIARLFEEAGLPPGALSVLVGAGGDIGDAFVQHPIPRFISFTGSTAVGKRIAALVAESPVLKRVALELGGNAPFVVLDDANLDEAVNAAIFGKFLHYGQICMCINRLIVDAKLYPAFVDKFTARAAKLVCGNPADPATHIGPVINKQQADKLAAAIAQARADGARETLKGDVNGLMISPHVFADVKPGSKLVMEETFGPVAAIIKADGEDHALEIANSTSYGLASSVFTKNIERGARFAQKLVTGMTHINDIPIGDITNAPFGGEKNSGIGRFNGDWLMEELTTLHWISTQETAGPYPF